MPKTDFHMHTTFVDGQNSVEEMAAAAYAVGFTAIGFSEHAHTPHNDSCCLGPHDTAAYLSTVREVAAEYAGRMRIYAGLELDYFAPLVAGLDYSIGSVHDVQKDGCYFSVDHTVDILKNAAARHYDGDMLAVAEDFYAQAAQVIAKTQADIIGHFDLVSKFNEKHQLFDAEDARYRRAWQNAAKELIGYGKPFEINTGAMSRGYRTMPYPSVEIMEFIRDNGGFFVINSDAHYCASIGHAFDLAHQLVRELRLPLVNMEEVLQNKKQG
ncbi:MAG: histidinol-phosphatase [Firmicutes bacterium]|nr:histidinol-phosphatase [Bacillota bacterium]